MTSEEASDLYDKGVISQSEFHKFSLDAGAISQEEFDTLEGKQAGSPVLDAVGGALKKSIPFLPVVPTGKEYDGMRPMTQEEFDKDTPAPDMTFSNPLSLAARSAALKVPGSRAADPLTLGLKPEQALAGVKKIEQVIIPAEKLRKDIGGAFAQGLEAMTQTADMQPTAAAGALMHLPDTPLDETGKALAQNVGEEVSRMVPMTPTEGIEFGIFGSMIEGLTRAGIMTASRLAPIKTLKAFMPIGSGKQFDAAYENAVKRAEQMAANKMPGAAPEEVKKAAEDFVDLYAKVKVDRAMGFRGMKSQPADLALTPFTGDAAAREQGVPDTFNGPVGPEPAPSMPGMAGNAQGEAAAGQIQPIPRPVDALPVPIRSDIGPDLAQNVLKMSETDPVAALRQVVSAGSWSKVDAFVADLAGSLQGLPPEQAKMELQARLGAVVQQAIAPALPPVPAEDPVAADPQLAMAQAKQQVVKRLLDSGAVTEKDLPDLVMNKSGLTVQDAVERGMAQGKDPAAVADEYAGYLAEQKNLAAAEQERVAKVKSLETVHPEAGKKAYEMTEEEFTRSIREDKAIPPEQQPPAELIAQLYKEIVAGAKAENLPQPAVDESPLDDNAPVDVSFNPAEFEAAPADGVAQTVALKPNHPAGMTPAEFARRFPDAPEGAHKAVVRAALRAGYDLPEETLKAYPDAVRQNQEDWDAKESRQHGEVPPGEALVSLIRSRGGIELAGYKKHWGGEMDDEIGRLIRKNGATSVSNIAEAAHEAGIIPSNDEYLVFDLLRKHRFEKQFGQTAVSAKDTYYDPSKLPGKPAQRKPLVAVHNTVLENLKKSVDLDALFMPSIAVTKYGVAHSDFGDITLVMKPEAVDPANPKNRAFASDAWTPRAPKFTFPVEKKAAARLMGEFRSWFKKRFASDTAGITNFGIFDSGVDDFILTQTNPAFTKDINASFGSSVGELLVWKFLSDRSLLEGVRHATEVAKAPISSLHFEQFSQDLAKRFDDLLRDMEPARVVTHSNPRYVYEARTMLEMGDGTMLHTPGLRTDASDAKVVYGIWDLEASKGAPAEFVVAMTGPDDIVPDAVSELHHLSQTHKVDLSKYGITIKVTRPATLAADYMAWVGELFDGVYKGMDPVDAETGAAIVPEEYIAAHGSDIIGKEDAATAGIPQMVRSLLRGEFKSLGEMKKKTHLLDKNDAQENKAIRLSEDLARKAQNGILLAIMQTNPDWMEYAAEHSLNVAEQSKAAILDFATRYGSDPSLAGFYKSIAAGFGEEGKFALEDEGSGFKEALKPVYDQIVPWFEMVKNAKGAYFEVKAMRLPGFNEVHAMVVPSSLLPSVRRMLRKYPHILLYGYKSFEGRVVATQYASLPAVFRDPVEYDPRALNGKPVSVVRYATDATANTDAFRGGTWHMTKDSGEAYRKDFKGRTDGVVGGDKVFENVLNIKRPLVIEDAMLEDGSFSVINSGYESYLPPLQRRLANGLGELMFQSEDGIKPADIKKALVKNGNTPEEIARVEGSKNFWDAAMDLIVSKGLRARHYDALILRNVNKAGVVTDRHIFKLAVEPGAFVPPTDWVMASGAEYNPGFGKREEIKTNGMDGEIVVIKNPTSADFDVMRKSFTRTFRELYGRLPVKADFDEGRIRILRDKKGNVYAWPSIEGTHGGVQIALDNMGYPTIDPKSENAEYMMAPGAEYSAVRGLPGFYSKLAQVLQQKMGGSAPAEQIRGLVKSAGIKQDELDWYDLDSFLAENHKPTKQQVMDYLAANALEIREVTHGPAGAVEHGPVAKETVHHRWIIAGGTNYREKLFLLDKDLFRVRMTEQDRKRIKDLQKRVDDLPGGWDELPAVEKDEYNALSDKADAAALGDNAYTHPHWHGYKNVVAHLRIADHVIDGKKTLMVNEDQSDLHQQGRDEGYKLNASEIQKKLAAVQKEKYDFGPAYDKLRAEWVKNEKAPHPEFEAARKKLQELTKKENELLGETIAGVPNAPLKKTWHEFVMKRALQYAIENGYEAIAWTTGDQQAARYNLGVVANSVEAYRPTEDTVNFVVRGHSDQIIFEENNVPLSRMAEVVGKDLVAKLKAEAVQVSKKFSGLDLRIGGEGMKSFYDKALPDFMRKFTKKWNGVVEFKNVDVKVDPTVELWATMRELNDEYGAMDPAELEDGLGEIRDRMIAKNESINEAIYHVMKRGKHKDVAGGVSATLHDLVAYDVLDAAKLGQTITKETYLNDPMFDIPQAMQDEFHAQAVREAEAKGLDDEKNPDDFMESVTGRQLELSEEWAKNNAPKITPVEPVHFMAITPEMRKSIMDSGMSVFTGKEQGEEGARFAGGFPAAVEQVKSTLGALRPFGQAHALGLPILAEKISKDLAEKGLVKYTGLQVNTVQDMAEVAAAARHPYLEHISVQFLKDGKLVSSFVTGSGLISSAEVPFGRIREQFKASGADKIVVAHNHPDGVIKHSGGDLAIKKTLEAVYGDALEAFIIVDHEKFRVLRDDEDFSDLAYKSSKEEFRAAGYKYYEVFSRLREMYRGDGVGVIFLDASQTVMSFDTCSPDQVTGYIKDNFKRYGADRYILVGNAKAVNSLKDGLWVGVQDIVLVSDTGVYSSAKLGEVAGKVIGPKAHEEGYVGLVELERARKARLEASGAPYSGRQVTFNRAVDKMGLKVGDSLTTRVPVKDSMLKGGRIPSGVVVTVAGIDREGLSVLVQRGQEFVSAPLEAFVEGQKTLGSFKERQFIDNVKGADRVAPEIKAGISSTYESISNEETLAEAEQIITSDYNRALEMAYSFEKPDRVSNTIAMRLIDRLQAAGDFEGAKRLIEHTAERNTQMGQAIQALAMYRRLTPEGVLKYATKVVKDAQQTGGFADLVKQLDKLQDEAGRVAFAKKHGIPYLSEQAAEEIYKMALSLKSMPEGREKDIATAKMLQKIADLTPKSFWEKVSSLQILAQLLNPKTIIRNILGNTAFMGLENVSQITSVPLDILAGKFTGARTAVMPSYLTQYRGFKAGAVEGAQEAMAGVDLQKINNKFDLPAGSVFDSRVLKALEKTLNMVLKMPDKAAYRAAFEDSLRGQLLLAKTEAPTPEMIAQAHLDGLYRTFNDPNALRDGFSRVKKALNTLSGVVTGTNKWGLGDMVLKYPGTPASILMRGIEYSPFGFTQTVYLLARAATKHDFNQREFVRSTSRALVGSSLLVGVGAILSLLGLLRGRREDQAKVAMTEEIVGLSDYQINTTGLMRFAASGMDPEQAKVQAGDLWLTYDWAQPMSINLAMGANMAENKERGAITVLTDAMMNASQTLVEQPLLQGVARISQYGNVLKGIISAAKDIPASFIPTIVNQVRQLVDNTARSTKDQNGMVEVKNKILYKIPWASKTLPPQVNGLGAMRELYQDGSNNPFNVFLNPAFATTYKPFPAAKMVLDIWANTGEISQFPRRAPASVTVKGVKYPLDSETQALFQMYIGNKTDVLFTAYALNPEFARLPDVKKAKMLNDALTDIGQEARRTILGVR